jgi:hypothetical protein
VTAVSKRYNGTYTDENQGGGKLPKVDRFSVWNEPNLKGWLQPTNMNVKIYRDLFYAAQKGLSKGKQARAQLLLGEVAPLKSLRFYQQLFCIDPAGKALKNRAAAKAGCPSGRRIKRLKATGIAHHPYARGGAPPVKPTGRDDITLNDMAKLTKVLSQGAKAGAIKSNLKIYFTEFGIASKPPSEKYGVAQAEQARLLNRSECIAYDNKAVSSFAQFQINDDTNIGSQGGNVAFQTGLRKGDGTDKLSYAAFRMPIYVTRVGGQARVWGGVRPGAGDNVDIQTESGGTFTTLKTVTVNSSGYIDEKIDPPSGKIRLRWTSPSGEEFTSREAVIDTP